MTKSSLRKERKYLIEKKLWLSIYALLIDFLQIKWLIFRAYNSNILLNDNNKPIYKYRKLKINIKMFTPKTA